MSAQSENLLLLRHFDAWARERKKVVDLDLLDVVLGLRSAYGDLEATYWPTGSVEGLLVDLLPARGPAEAPDGPVLEATLDAFVRFLRNTGRLARHSATPDALRRELRRSVRLMGERAVNRSSWSAGKVLGDYGRSIGIELDGAPDQATLEARLAAINDSWNALPTFVRQRMMPHPGDEKWSGRERAMSTFQTDDELMALLLALREGLPTGQLPTAAVTAPIVESSGLVARIEALTRWMPARLEVTSTGNIRPRDLRAAYDALELDPWARAAVSSRFRHHEPAGVAAVGLDVWVEREVTRPWRHLGDCFALERVWRAAVASRAVVLSGKWASPGLAARRDPEASVRLGLSAGVRLLDDLLEFPGRGIGLVYSLVESYKRSCAPVPWAETLDFVTSWQNSQDEIDSLEGAGLVLADYGRGSLDEACFSLGDTGILELSDEGLGLTPLGDVFVTAWLKHMEQ